ncbi:MAG: helix-turn-helix transcriptional regulator [Phototrophicaceae bacterium]
MTTDTQRDYTQITDLQVGMDTLIARVETIRGTRLTQLEISHATGIPQGTISKWSNGYVSRLDKHIIVALLNYFNQYFECNLEDLLVLHTDE